LVCPSGNYENTYYFSIRGEINHPLTGASQGLFVFKRFSLNHASGYRLSPAWQERKAGMERGKRRNRLIRIIQKEKTLRYKVYQARPSSQQ
jgi:hypothetical protein